MLKLFKPNIQLPCLTEIELRLLEQHDVECLMLDMDCTLKDQYATDFCPEVIQWIDGMKQAGIQMAVVSNGRTGRIAPFAEQLGLFCVAAAAKPLPRGIRRGLNELGVEPHKAAIVGDQIFSDIVAGNLAGVTTILVRSCCTCEPWVTKIKRPFEKLVVRW